MAFFDGSRLRALAELFSPRSAAGGPGAFGALARPVPDPMNESWLPNFRAAMSSGKGLPGDWTPQPVVQHQGSGGLIGAIQARRAGAPGTPIRDWLGQNSTALMNFGAGLAGGKGWDQGIAQGLAGASQGREDDQKRRRRMAATQAIAEAQRAGTLTPELAAILSNHEDPAGALLEYRLKLEASGRDEPKIETFFSPDGREVKGYLNPNDPSGLGFTQVGGGKAVDVNELPTDLQLYQYDMDQRKAAGLPIIQYNQWDSERAQNRRAQNTVNMGPDGRMGTVPQDYMVIEDPAAVTPTNPKGLRQVVIPGSATDQKQQAAQQQAQERRGATERSTDVVLGKIAEVRNIVQTAPTLFPAVGFGATTLESYGGTPATNRRRAVETIEANIAFDALAAMRQASPTGGALGAITERELELLSATLTSLAGDQSQEQFLRHLDELEALYTEIKRKADAYPNAADFGFGDQAAAPDSGVVRWGRDPATGRPVPLGAQ